MAKLTVNFRGKPLNVYHHESGELTIGRDSQCTIRIDSLAVAPVHASLKAGDDDSWVLQSECDEPIFVNDEKVDSKELIDGDRIRIGKHEILYRDQENIVEAPTDTIPKDPVHDCVEQLELMQNVATARIQYLNGDHIGLMVPVKQAMTRLGQPGMSAAVIVKRHEGFFISSLDGGSSTKVNGTPIDDISVKLKHRDKIDIDKSRMQFFLAD